MTDRCRTSHRQSPAAATPRAIVVSPHPVGSGAGLGTYRCMPARDGPRVRHVSSGHALDTSGGYGTTRRLRGRGTVRSQVAGLPPSGGEQVIGRRLVATQRVVDTKS